MSTQSSFVNLATLLAIPGIHQDENFWQFAREMRVCVPAVVVSFNAATQLVTVQPAINEWIKFNSVPTWTPLPQLPQLQIGMFRAGGFSITFPVQAGDEGWVIFADMCINAWKKSGGTNNQQEEQRRHDLSDGWFLPVSWNQQRLLSGYSTNSLQIRSDDGNAVITVTESEIEVAVGSVNLIVTGSQVTVNGNLVVNGNISTASGTVTAGSIGLTTHEHTNVTNGPDITGPPA